MTLENKLQGLKETLYITKKIITNLTHNSIKLKEYYLGIGACDYSVINRLYHNSENM